MDTTWILHESDMDHSSVFIGSSMNPSYISNGALRYLPPKNPADYPWILYESNMDTPLIIYGFPIAHEFLVSYYITLLLKIKHIWPLIHNHVPTLNCDGMIGSVLALKFDSLNLFLFSHINTSVLRNIICISQSILCDPKEKV